MNSHDLARLLLSLPDLPVATHALNHTYCSSESADAITHGKLKVGRLKHYVGDHVVIGDISKRNINGPNWRVVEMWLGDAPEEWR